MFDSQFPLKINFNIEYSTVHVFLILWLDFSRLLTQIGYDSVSTQLQQQLDLVSKIKTNDLFISRARMEVRRFQHSPLWPQYSRGQHTVKVKCSKVLSLTVLLESLHFGEVSDRLNWCDLQVAVLVTVCFGGMALEYLIPIVLQLGLSAESLSLEADSFRYRLIP